MEIQYEATEEEFIKFYIYFHKKYNKIVRFKVKYLLSFLCGRNIFNTFKHQKEYLYFYIGC